MEFEEDLNTLEKYVFAPNKEKFLSELIQDTESYYYFSLLHSIEKYGVQLP